MPTLVEFPRCISCGTQQGYLFKCQVCDEWTCNECVTYELHGYPEDGPTDCHHEKFIPIPSTGWK